MILAEGVDHDLPGIGERRERVADECGADARTSMRSSHGQPVDLGGRRRTEQHAADDGVIVANAVRCGSGDGSSEGVPKVRHRAEPWFDRRDDVEPRLDVGRFGRHDGPWRWHVAATSIGALVEQSDDPTLPPMGDEWVVPDVDGGPVGGTAIDAAPGDDPSVAAGGEPIVDRRPIERFRRGAVGGVLAAGLSGLADVLDPRDKDEVAIVETVGGDPPRTERIVLRLDPDDPSDSIVMVRTWMDD